MTAPKPSTFQEQLVWLAQRRSVLQGQHWTVSTNSSTALLSWQISVSPPTSLRWDLGAVPVPAGTSGAQFALSRGSFL